jgi:hypothetical protein
MRVKNARTKFVDKRWLCTGCLTRYERRFQAVECVTRHNDETARQILKAGSTTVYASDSYK